MALSPGPETFTIERLRNAWREGQIVLGQPRRLQYESLQFDETPKHARYICRKLHASVQDPAGHLTRINETFAPFLEGRFRHDCISEDVVSSISMAKHILKANAWFLSRLCALPPPAFSWLFKSYHTPLLDDSNIMYQHFTPPTHFQDPRSPFKVPDFVDLLGR